MDLMVEKKSVKKSNYIMPIGIILVGICLSLVFLERTSLCFVLPLLLVCFNSGYQYIISYFIMSLIALSFIDNAQITLYISITSIIMFYICSFISFIKTKYLPILMIIISAIYLYVFGFNYIEIGVISLITLINSYLYLQLIPVVIHNKIDVYTNERLTIISIIVMISIISLYTINAVYTMVLLRFYILLAIFYLSMNSVIPAVLYVMIILILISPGLKDDVLAILLPISIFFMYRPKSKILFTSLYLVAHIILPFFISYDYNYYAVIVLTSALLFVISPKIKIKSLDINSSFKEITNQNKLINKANSFASLFQQLTDVFKENNQKINVSQYIGYVYEDICSKCSSREYCFNNKGDINRLGKLMIKGIRDNYNDEDLEYITNSCIRPDNYLDSIDNYHDSYQKMVNLSNENNNIRRDLFNEFSLIGDVFSNFSKSMDNLDNDDYCLKEHLLGYQFNVVYLKKSVINMQSYLLEIGIVDIDKETVKEELIPILQTYLNQTLSLVSLKDSNHHLGYTSIILKHQLEYIVQYGYQQFALDNNQCGDSYMTFQNNNHHYIALSDGMGQGNVASKESKLTLDVLSKLISNGIGLNDTINAINSLLKIKNHGDMYTTLDLCDINLTNAKLKLIKYGAYSSFIIRDGSLEVITTSSLPVGMSATIKMVCYEMALKENDIIIMASDGVKDNFKDIVESKLDEMCLMHPSEIATLLMSSVLNRDSLDDISIIVLKIVPRN